MRRRPLLVALLAAAALAHASPAYAGGRFVGSVRAFQQAVQDFRMTGGRIVLLPGDYHRPMVVGPRSDSQLEIVGSPGARVQTLSIVESQAVTVRGLVVRPMGANAIVTVERSRQIVFRGDAFTAKHTESKVGLRLDYSSGVLIRNSTFSHCGDRTPKWSTCLLPRWAARVRVVHNWFHDCRGCDFIGGRIGPSSVIRENRFDRALACHTGWAQLNLATADDGVRVINNLFLRDDPLAPGHVARVAILVGTRASPRIPLGTEIVNNTILSGAPKGHHAESSIVLSPGYSHVLRRNRPLIANNVIAWLMVPALVCGSDRDSLNNVVVAGTACGLTDVVGDPLLDAEGRPTAGSALVIDLADAALAPPVEIEGAPRVGPPDIGAFEYSG